MIWAVIRSYCEISIALSAVHRCQTVFDWIDHLRKIGALVILYLYSIAEVK